MATRKLEWLKSLKQAQLRQIAISIGAQCSGTKLALVRAIESSLHHDSRSEVGSTHQVYKDPLLDQKPLSLVSIDMGIRNLAYAHLTAVAMKQQLAGSQSFKFGNIQLRDWARLTVSPSPKDAISVAGSIEQIMSEKSGNPDMVLSETSTAPLDADRESFEPLVYAKYAFNFIDTLVKEHDPTHVLIERQRFRSGGQSAVQEWTIRVGVFEGMLHAVLNTLALTGKTNTHVESIQPQKVGRFWLDTDATTTVHITGKAFKKAKIDLVGRTLQNRKQSNSNLEVAGNAIPMADAFLEKWKGGSKENRSITSITKLDDLADSLLQGLAWIQWQNRREELRLLGLAATELG